MNSCDVLGAAVVLLAGVGLMTVIFLGGAAVYIGLQMVASKKGG